MESDGAAVSVADRVKVTALAVVSDPVAVSVAVRAGATVRATVSEGLAVSAAATDAATRVGRTAMVPANHVNADANAQAPGSSLAPLRARAP
jgi:hypothetical protein